MRTLLPLLALSALASGQAEAPQIRHGFFPEIRKGVAPDERRALIVDKALWQSAAGADYQAMTVFKVRRVGDAWLMTAGAPSSAAENESVLDGTSYMAFDSGDGGLFYAAPYAPPKDRDLIELLRRRRALVKRVME